MLAARVATIALLILFPLAWLAPLARARVLPLFSGSEISILNGVIELSESDLFLCIVVALFAMVIPYTKTILLLGALFGQLGEPDRWLKVLGAIGKLSMADVFLVAMYIVAIKGVGVGEITVEWGLYFFTLLVLALMAVTWLTERAMRRKGMLDG